jgi:hypothetical protein
MEDIPSDSAWQPRDPNETEYCTDGCATTDPAYLADRDRDIRMCCVRAALDLHRPGETTAKAVVEEAQQILNFLNGSAQ